jgi:preprotein translocase subunit SecB
MTATPSPLELRSFLLLESRYKFIPAETGQDTREFFNSYEIDADWGRAYTDDNGEFNVFLKIAINQGKAPKPGYSLYAECVGIFALETDSLEPEQVENLSTFSSLVITLGCLRGVLLSLTAQGPAGAYVLPSLDTNELIRSKVEAEAKPRKASRKKRIEL